MTVSGYCLITGASRGIGRQLAIQAAEHGRSLIIVARHQQDLESLKVQIKDQYPVDVIILAMDLAVPGAASALIESVDRCGVKITECIMNAGFGKLGPFAAIDKLQANDMMMLNMVFLTHFVRLILERMLLIDQGRIMLVSSVASFTPGPFFALYYASKAFVTSLGLALHDELQSSNITITTVCPGMTASHFGQVAGVDEEKIKPLRVLAQSSHAVAKSSYAAMIKGKRSHIPGWINVFYVYVVMRIIPASWLRRLLANRHQYLVN